MSPVTRPDDSQLDNAMATESEVTAQVAAHVVAHHTPTNLTGTDDFVGGDEGGALGWVAVTSGGASAGATTTVGVTAGKPGRWEVRAGTTNTSRRALTLSLTGIVLGGGAYASKWIWQVQALIVAGTENYAHAVGLMDIVTAEPTNGVYLWYDSASPNWICKTARAGTRTATNSGVAVAAGTDVTFEATVNAAGTSVEFRINGVLRATHTTNIPIVAVGPGIFINRLTPASASRSVYLDYFRHDYTLTTPR